MSARAGRAVSGGQRGVTLVELIAFIVIAGVVATLLAQAFGGSLSGIARGRDSAVAAGLAQERMELILGQHRKSGSVFATFSDPCTAPSPPQQACAAIAGFTVASSIASNSSDCTGAASVDCRSVTVTVTGPDGATAARLVAHMMNY